MVEKFKAILVRVIQDKGPVSVFAIIKMDEITDRWSVLLSAPWINSENESEVFRYLAGLIRADLAEEERASIARIGIFAPDEHIIRLFLDSVSVAEGSVATLKDVRLNGYKVHEAYVFASSKPQ